MVEIDKGSKVK